MTTIRLRGVAYRYPPEWAGIAPDTIVPETVPVYVEYAGEPVGTAALRRDAEGAIWADATVEDGPWQETCEYLAMSFMVGPPEKAISVHLTASVLSNKVGDYHPPFEIVVDEPA